VDGEYDLWCRVARNSLFYECIERAMTNARKASEDARGGRPDEISRFPGTQCLHCAYEEPG